MVGNSEFVLENQQANTMFSESANTIQVILTLVLVLLFHINIETNTCTSVAHNSPISTPRSSRQLPSGVEINVVFRAVFKTRLSSLLSS